MLTGSDSKGLGEIDRAQRCMQGLAHSQGPWGSPAPPLTPPHPRLPAQSREQAGSLLQGDSSLLTQTLGDFAWACL